MTDSNNPREEPSAGKPHARIREGEAEWLSYSTIAWYGSVRRFQKRWAVRVRRSRWNCPGLGALIDLGLPLEAG